MLDLQPAFLKVYIAPMQGEQLAAPQPRHEFEVEGGEQAAPLGFGETENELIGEWRTGLFERA